MLEDVSELGLVVKVSQMREEIRNMSEIFMVNLHRGANAMLLLAALKGIMVS